jgi:C4-type Zn-finger protein
MINEFNIYITDYSPNHGGYIECPICNNHMDYHKVKDHHDYWGPTYDDPPVIMTRTEIYLYSLHCSSCDTTIDNITLVATEQHQVVFHDRRLECPKLQLH